MRLQVDGGGRREKRKERREGREEEEGQGWREHRGRIRLYCVLWPSLSSHTVSSLPHFISGSNYKGYSGSRGENINSPLNGGKLMSHGKKRMCHGLYGTAAWFGKHYSR